MNDFAFNLNLAPQLFEPETAASLACLSPFPEAVDGRVAAIPLCYSDASPGPLRDEGPDFFARAGNRIKIMPCRVLSPLVRAGLADAVLRLEDDAIFGQHLRAVMSAPAVARVEFAHATKVRSPPIVLKNSGSRFKAENRRTSVLRMSKNIPRDRLIRSEEGQCSTL